jgi:hypothetical protein
MWYRIELNRDGSVGACTEVEATIPVRGGRVYFIEADTKEQALATGLARYNAYLESQRASMRVKREQLKAEGRCRDCRGVLDRDGIRCASCAKRCVALRDKLEVPGVRGVPRAETLANKLPTNTRLLVLHEVLGKFDRLTPRAFRAWLLAAVEKSERNQAEKSTRAA